MEDFGLDIIEPKFLTLISTDNQEFEIEEKYVKTGKLEAKWVELLDHTREIRHNNQYDLSFCSTEKEAQKAMTASDKFLERMKVLLNSL